MPMKPEHRQTIIDTITARVAEAQKTNKQPVGCPICGQNNWDVGEEFVSIGTANVLGVLTEGKYLPSVVLICTTCGTQQFVNLSALGLGGIGTPDRTAPLIVNTTSLRAPPPVPQSSHQQSPVSAVSTDAMRRAIEEAKRGK